MNQWRDVTNVRLGPAAPIAAPRAAADANVAVWSTAEPPKKQTHVPFENSSC